MDKLSGKHLLLINTLLILVQYGCYSFCKNTYILCAVAFLCKSTATMLFIMVTLKIVLDIAQGQNTVTALSLIATIKAIGGVVISYLTGYLADIFGIPAAYLLLLAIGGLSGLLLVFLHLPKSGQTYFHGTSAVQED